MDSRSLVPGDLLVVKDSWLLPCDLLILEGAASSVLYIMQYASIPYITCLLQHLARKCVICKRCQECADLKIQLLFTANHHLVPVPALPGICGNARPCRHLLACECRALLRHMLSKEGTVLLRCCTVSNASHCVCGLTMRTLSSMRQPAH